MQDHAADELHVEVAHLHGAPAGFADDGEGLGQDLIECGALGSFDFLGIGDAFETRSDAGFEFGGLGAQLFV